MRTYYKNDRGIVVRIDGADYVHHGYVNGRHDLRHAVTGLPYVAKGRDGVVALLDDEGFDDLLETHRLEILSTRTVDRVRLLNDASELTIADACELDPHVRKMLVQIEMLDGAGVKNGDKAIERHFDRDGNWTDELKAQWGEHDPARTIRHWRRTRGQKGCRHPRQMIRLTGRLARSRRSDVENELLWKHALIHRAKGGGLPEAHGAYCEEVRLVNSGAHPVHPASDKPYEPVGERTFRRRVEKLECDATAAAGGGAAALEQDRRGAGRPLKADHVMQMVIIDHTTFDVFVVDPDRGIVLGRPTLTLAIDVRTRAIVAHVVSFVDPSIWTVGETLRRMALPKRPPEAMVRRYPILRRLRGRPDEIIVDNAIEFRSLMLQAAARGLGFRVRFCPLAKPRYRAVVERIIKTVNLMVCRELPGRVLPPREVKRLGYDGEAEAIIIMDELEAVTNHVVAEVNTTPHPAIGNHTPAGYFEREAARTGVMNFRDLGRFRIETMDVVEGAQLDAAGITRWGLRFAHHSRVPELLDDLAAAEPRRSRRERTTATVDFRYDPLDLGSIWVWNRISMEYVELECDDPEYAKGMPLSFHKELVRESSTRREAFNTKQERQEARSRRIAAIRSISPEALAARRRELAKLLEIPRMRAIVGNIVDVDIHTTAPGDLEAFIGCDQASLTALDMEILDRPRGERSAERPDEWSAGRTDAPSEAGPPPARAAEQRVTRGGYR